MADQSNTVELTADQAREVLRYDPETGKLTWLHRARRFFGADHEWRSWNTKYAGRETFLADNGRGYLRGHIFDKSYLAHRVIWLIQTGEWPESQIDHINGVKIDNRWENLRSVTPMQNGKNFSLSSRNSSGVSGVYWIPKRQKWHLQVRADGARKHIGYFDTLEEAAEARQAANQKYGFSERHGT